MRVSARETVKRKFSISRCVNEYENIYLDLIKKKGRRIKRGPALAPPTPEVDIADALYHLNAGRFDGFTESIMKITPPGDGREFIVKQLKNIGHDDPEIVMLLADQSIEAGNTTKALDILEEGARKFPDSKAIIETCALLKSKIDR